MEREKTTLLLLPKQKSLEGLRDDLLGDDWRVVPTTNKDVFQAVLRHGHVLTAVFDPACIQGEPERPELRFDFLKETPWIPKIAYTNNVNLSNQLWSERAVAYSSIPKNNTLCADLERLLAQVYPAADQPENARGRRFGWELKIDSHARPKVTLGGLVERLEAGLSPDARRSRVSVDLVEQRREELGDVLRWLFPKNGCLWLGALLTERDGWVCLPVEYVHERQSRQYLLILTTRQAALREVEAYKNLARGAGQHRVPLYVNDEALTHFGAALYELDTDPAALISCRQVGQPGRPGWGEFLAALESALPRWTTPPLVSTADRQAAFITQALNPAEPLILAEELSAVLDSLADQFERIDFHIERQAGGLRLRSTGQSQPTNFADPVMLLTSQDLLDVVGGALSCQPDCDPDTVFYHPAGRQVYFTRFSTGNDVPIWWGRAGLAAGLLLDGPLRELEDAVERLCRLARPQASPGSDPAPAASGDGDSSGALQQGEALAPTSPPSVPEPDTLDLLLNGQDALQICLAVFYYDVDRLVGLAPTPGLPQADLQRARIRVHALAHLGQVLSEALNLPAQPVAIPLPDTTGLTKLSYDSHLETFFIANNELRLSPTHKRILKILWDAKGAPVKYKQIYALLDNAHKDEYHRKNDAYQVINALRDAIVEANIPGGKDWIITIRGEGWRLNQDNMLDLG